MLRHSSLCRVAAAAAAGGAGSSSSSSSSSSAYHDSKLPTRETYEAMTDDELQNAIRTKDTQIAQLRHIYENFHYEVDKRFRTMIFDYHDKALSLSKVHGDMQMSSLTINREALMRMREAQEAQNRDRRLVLIICFVSTIVFWFWLRRHYVRALEDNDPTLTVAISGLGISDNIFSSKKRSGRSWDTPYEREVREKREKEEQQQEEKQRKQENV